MSTTIQYIALFIFPLGMAFAAASDLLTMTISNRLTLALAAAFLVVAPFSGMSLETFGVHVAAGVAVLAIAFGCFAMGWIGGGDAKLAAVAALWLGGATLAFIAMASIFGGVLTFFLLSFRSRVLPLFVLRQPWVQRLHDPKEGVPYGIALAAAGLAVYPHTVWMQMVSG